MIIKFQTALKQKICQRQKGEDSLIRNGAQFAEAYAAKYAEEGEEISLGTGWNPRFFSERNKKSRY
jgi:hypothetical protein